MSANSTAARSWLIVVLSVLAVITVATAVMAVFSRWVAQPEGAATHWTKRINWSVVSLLMSLAVMTVVVFMAVSPSERDPHYFSDMYCRWTDLRQNVDLLIDEYQADSKSATPSDAARFEQRFRELVAWKNQIQSNEQAPNRDLVEKCWEDENESRTGYRTTDPNEKPRTSGRVTVGASSQLELR